MGFNNFLVTAIKCTVHTTEISPILSQGECSFHTPFLTGSDDSITLLAQRTIAQREKTGRTVTL